MNAQMLISMLFWGENNEVLFYTLFSLTYNYMIFETYKWNRRKVAFQKEVITWLGLVAF